MELPLELSKDLLSDICQLEEKRGKLFDRRARVHDPCLILGHADLGLSCQTAKADRNSCRDVRAEIAAASARIA